VEVEDIVNRIGEFHICINEEVIQLTGTLRLDGNDLILECQISTNQTKEIKQSLCNVYGTVAGIQITLLNGYISKYVRRNNKTVYHSIIIKPSEIIIGRTYPQEIKITKITSSINALNYMFSKPPLKLMHSFSEENISLLNYSFLPPITAQDTEGEISIYQTFSYERSRDKITFVMIPVIELSFFKPVLIEDAITKIASIRNLMSFFADYYLPLENIRFSDIDSEIIDDNVFCDCTLLLNQREEITSLAKPFLIKTEVFENIFHTIWHNWSKFYKETNYIVILFYEIISNRSTYINRFLNLVQALEIYAEYYRGEETKEIANADGYRKSGILPLKYHIESILFFLNSYFNFKNSDINALSNRISNMRHFYTHFNRKKYDEPSFQQLSSANRVLRFMLLAIVYKTIGITDEHIKNCLKTSDYSTFYNDVDILLGQDSLTTSSSL